MPFVNSIYMYHDYHDIETQQNRVCRTYWKEISKDISGNAEISLLLI